MLSREIEIEMPDDIVLAGTWTVPAAPRGTVIFAHGSGSSRFSKRNALVANVLQAAGFATLLVDLLTRAEETIDEVTGELRFDIPLLAERVVWSITWARRASATPIGLFGASTGAAAALVAAAARTDDVAAVVSRGGRPDLASGALPAVRAPTLLIVGALDAQVLQLNHQAQRLMTSHTQLAIVPGATHLFEEPGALEQVAGLAQSWFDQHLPPAQPHARPAHAP